MTQKLFPNIIAHRGAPFYFTENTLKSFQTAIDIGADFIEIDVRCTRDNELIVWHDPSIDRLTHAYGLVQFFSLKDLRKIKILEQENIPTLEDIFTTFKGKTKFVIDYKMDRLTFKLLKLIDKHKLRRDVIISSFNKKALRRIRRSDKKIKLALLTWYITKKDIKFFKEYHLNYIHPFYLFLSRKKISTMEENHIKYNVWTINRQRSLRKILKYNPSGIISDKPDLIKNFEK